MEIALIAHDKKKEEMIKLIKENKDLFSRHSLIATGTTGKMIKDKTGLAVECLMSGPLGGDQQIGSRIAAGEVDLVIFLRDPLTAQPHEPDISALIRICDVHNIPIATNLGTAKLVLQALATME
ncbi:methylglyoxal synthase [Desulfofundulus salinus]|uniref:Methylglyoxal synthase n=1 Tax=Desulfofundulus salinus TaxID=2419843 RepID=A0A494WXK7_9FIRM|nr:methylglyoxal synthase [Desulfofundulus salinum]RKO67032.1 methylglyoxal synthase [Desulfofundulus salinum]